VQAIVTIGKEANEQDQRAAVAHRAAGRQIDQRSITYPVRRDAG
jgi:hypothetical protein